MGVKLALADLALAMVDAVRRRRGADMAAVRIPFAWAGVFAVAAVVVAVVIGRGVLARFGSSPLRVAVISTVAYAVFALRDHELGLLLPPMIVAFARVALGTVIGVFFFTPLLVGEIVRLRRLVRAP